MASCTKAVTYRWVRHEGQRLYDVGLLSDGSLHNPRNYPADMVRSAVLAVVERQRARRSDAAKRAAVTRQLRQGRKGYLIAEAIAAGGEVKSSERCRICGRTLEDAASIERGVGPECWAGVLDSIEAKAGGADE